MGDYGSSRVGEDIVTEDMVGVIVRVYYDYPLGFLLDPSQNLCGCLFVETCVEHQTGLGVYDQSLIRPVGVESIIPDTYAGKRICPNFGDPDNRA